MSIEDATCVDGLGIGELDGYVVLLISDHLTWDDELSHFGLLEKKLGSYLGFIKSGQLIEKLPEAKGRPIRIELVHEHLPTENAHRFVGAATRQLRDIGVQLTIRALPDGF
jgi:hypothetical protein